MTAPAERRYVVEADGGSRGNPGPAGYGSVVRDATDGQALAERAASIGTATNNVAEYRGLIAGLEAAAELGADAVDVRMDSKLVIEQMAGRWRVKHPDLKPLASRAAGLVRDIGPVTFTWVPRAGNSHADRLANEAMDHAARGEVWTEGAGSGADPADDDRLPFADGAPAAAQLDAGSRAVTGPPTTVVLVRHGATELSGSGRWTGHRDLPLTAEGRAQAEALAGRLGTVPEVAAVVSSHLRRTRDTAEVIGAALGLTPRTDADLSEFDAGEWEGLAVDDIRARWPREYAAWAGSGAAAPGGESLAAAGRRWRRARDAMLASYAGHTVIAVTHAGAVKGLVQQVLGAPEASGRLIAVDPASITTIAWDAAGEGRVLGVNDTSHLERVSTGSAP